MEKGLPPDMKGHIHVPNKNDVLSGRGGRVNSHPGNIQFRRLCDEYRTQYLLTTTKKSDKAKIADRLVQRIRNMDPPGRFLKECQESGLWGDIGDERARKKTSHAIRVSLPLDG